jgi:uncharacterized protein HemX
MKPRNTAETGIICAAVVIVVALLTIPFEVGSPSTGQHNYGKPLVLLAVVAVIGLALVGGYRYLSSRHRDRLQLTSGEKYQQLAEEYRRLADLAITAQEHTDLKLADVSVQLDFLRQQNESLQTILKEVE